MKHGLLSLMVYIFFIHAPKAQENIHTRGLKVINHPDSFRISISNDPGKKMVDLKRVIPGIFLDLKYCSPDNFIQKRLYPLVHTTYLRQEAAQALEKVQQDLLERNLSLKIWDAYRPYSVTKKIWDMVKDDRYAADPKSGSNHNRGIAVDVTIVDINTAAELAMGTGFDNFSDTAHHEFNQLPHNVIQNRLLLKSLMEKHGFVALRSEWWHYYLPSPHRYELLDLNFRQLARLSR